MKPLSVERFNLLAGYCRMPATRIVTEELEWREAGNERVLGLVLRDRTDNDFGWVLLARDRLRRFRAVTFEHSMQSRKAAREGLKKAMAKAMRKRADEFFQGDEKGDPVDFFRPVVANEKLNKAFREISTKGTYPSARLLKEMMHWYTDVDGNFIEQFQTVAFDARLWELYIFATFDELGYAFDHEFNAPDFSCIGLLGRFFIEATTVNPSNPPQDITELTEEEYYRDYVPKKYGSALYSKLKKRYWDKEHVKGQPLIFAIQDFHEWLSMSWSLYALSEFVYGARTIKEAAADGSYRLVTETVDYKFGDETLQGGFFSMTDAENVSAVIANPGGTIAKFDRMGLQAGFGGGKTSIVRGGLYLSDSGYEVPLPFTYTVNDGTYRETWVEGLTVFHNPNALFPLDPLAIPGAAHFFYEGGEITGNVPTFHPIGSTSFVMHATNSIDLSDREARDFIERKLNTRFKKTPE